MATNHDPMANPFAPPPPRQTGDVGLPPRLLWAMNALLVVALLVDYGFRVNPLVAGALEWLTLALALGYAGDLGLMLANARQRRALLRARWYEYALLPLGLAAMAVMGVAAVIGTGEALASAFDQESLSTLFVKTAQLYALANLAIRVLRPQERLLTLGVRPENLFVGSFLLLILLGALTLLLPGAGAGGTKPPLSAVDALFTATSAVCVTGLSVRDLGTEFSHIGQMIVLALIQLGGLSIITVVALLAVVSKETLNVPEMVVLRDLVSARTVSDVRRQVLAIIAITIVVEVVGALLLYLFLPVSQTGLARWKWCVYHSISAFCNAGFSLNYNSLEPLAGNWGVCLTIMGLITVGGLGFPVIRDLLAWRPRVPRPLCYLPRLHAWQLAHPPRRFRLQTQLSMLVTAALLVTGVVGIYLLEAQHSLQGRPVDEQALVTLFHAVTPRTAGFNTVPLSALQNGTLLLLMGLMVIGASPVSTGGGMKTLTFAVLLLTLRAMFRGREQVEAFGRTIPRRAVHAAVSVSLIYLGTAALVTFVLTLTDPQMLVRDLAFEAVSALSTVGLSLGITPQLSPGGKLVLCLAMFVGRVGPLTLALSFFRARGVGRHYSYPEEDLVVG